MINLLIANRKRIMLISLGIVYLWFGTLKFFPGISPAESLAKSTLAMLTFNLIPSNITYFLLALWEVTIGILFLINVQQKVAIYLALVHILFTFTPLFLLPELSFNQKIYTLTLVGQYIFKNLIIFSALLFVYPEKKQVAVV